MADGADLPPDDAALLAVGAHGMLSSVSVAKATIATLRLHWGRLDEATVLRLLGRAEDQLGFLADALADLVRGIPSEARQALDQLQPPADPSGPPPPRRS
jgi:hypothetical protein